ncbi:XdhC family protein [Paremcibacter congregatus]|uniref:XdhC family protein n=1 Tax=Paremcibacter congregatus TaxID=2043170 RepID=UPI003A941CB3
MSSDWKPLWRKIKQWHEAGHSMALATVVDTWGASPRPVGSYMLLNDRGEIEGSVSGGCIEGAVIEAAQETMANGVPQLLDFEASNDRAWEVGLSCGGRVRVLVESMTTKIDFIPQVLEATEALELITDCQTGHTILATPQSATDKSYLREEQGHDRFHHILAQPLHVIVIGAVHITQAMMKIADSLDLAVTIIDPRGRFATAERFPGRTMVSDWPDEYLTRHPITGSTAVITLSHDPKLDDPALEIALTSPCFYIAALGSRKTQAARQDRLRAKGFTEQQIDRIHGPAGLDIGARTPAEIALSIMAQLVDIYHNGTAL